MKMQSGCLIQAIIVVSLIVIEQLPGWAQENQNGEAIPVSLTPLTATISYGDVESLTDQIVEQKLELLRLNINLKLQTGQQSLWKSRRSALYSIICSSSMFSGVLAKALMRYKYQEHPKLASLRLQEQVVIPQLTSSCIGSVTPIIEFILDNLADLRLHKHGFDIKLVSKHAHELQAEIDRLMSERLKAISNCQDLSDYKRKLIATEGDILSTVRDLEVSEYVQFCAKAKESKAARNISYICSFSKSCIGAVSNIVSLYSLERGKPKLTGQGQSCTTISGAIIVATPWLSRCGGSVVRHFYKSRLSHEM